MNPGAGDPAVVICPDKDMPVAFLSAPREKHPLLRATLGLNCACFFFFFGGGGGGLLKQTVVFACFLFYLSSMSPSGGAGSSRGSDLSTSACFWRFLVERGGGGRQT